MGAKRQGLAETGLAGFEQTAREADSKKPERGEVSRTRLSDDL